MNSPSTRIICAAAVTAAAVVVFAFPALAADAADWINPASEGAKSLSDSLVSIGAPILGLCLAGYGIWGIATGHLDFRRLWMLLIGGAFVGVGTKFGTWFMALFGN